MCFSKFINSVFKEFYLSNNAILNFVYSIVYFFQKIFVFPLSSRQLLLTSHY